MTGLIALSACSRERTHVEPGKLIVRWELPAQIVAPDINPKTLQIDAQLDKQLRTIGNYQLTKKIQYQNNQQTESYIAEFIGPISEEKRRQAISQLIGMLGKYHVSITSEGDKKITTRTIALLPW